MTELAHGHIVVELDDRASKELERLDAQHARTMRDIDRRDATVTLNADLDKLKDDLSRAKREVKEYEQYVAKADSTYTRKARQLSLDRARQAEAEAAKKVAAQEKVVNSYDKESAALKRVDDRTKATTKHAVAREKVLEANHRRAMARQREEERASDRASRTKAREIREEERAAALRQRELDALPKLQREYVVLADKIEKLVDVRRRVAREGSEMALMKVDFDRQAAVHRFNQIGEILERENVAVNIPVKFDRGAFIGETIRVELGRNHSMLAAASGVGAALGTQMATGMATRFRRQASRGIGGTLSDIGNAGARMVAGGMGRIGNILSSLSEMTVRVGPFTATFRQLLMALSVLGPAIVSTIGALGALTSATAAAALGFGALGVGLLGGMIPAFAGVFMAVKPVAKQFKEAMTASKAYHKEVLQSGKNSEEAKEKLKALDAVLGNVDKRTRENFVAAGNLSQAWRKATAPARAAAFRLIGEGIRFASDNMGWFAKRTNETTGVLERGFTRMMKGLDTGAFDSMMGNFNKALGPAIDGIANLINYFARVGEVASGFLPDMAKGFRKWSQGILDTTKNTEQFEAKIRRVVNVARDMGSFFMAGGRLLKAFFAGGVQSGQDFLNTMTDAMNRWTEFLNTKAGQEKLSTFFERSVNGAQALYSALAPLLSTFVKWAVAMEPVASGFFKAAGAIADLIGSILSMTALRGPLTALGATLGTLWAVGKISAFIGMIRSATAALLGLKAASTGVALASAAGGLGSLGKVARGAALTGIAADLALMGRNADDAGKKVGRTRGFLSTLTGTAAKLAPMLIRVGTVAGIAGTAALLFGGESKSAADKAEELAEAADNLGEAAERGGKRSAAAYNLMADSTLNLRGARKEVKAAQEEVDRLTKAGKTGSAEYTAALQRLNSALQAVNQSERARGKAMEAIRAVNRAVQGSTEAVTKATESQATALKEVHKQIYAGDADQVREITGKDIWELSARDVAKYADELKDLRNADDESRAAIDATVKAYDALKNARQRDMAAAQQQMVSAANLQRSMSGFRALGQQAGKVMGDLASKIGGKKTMEIAIKFPNPRQALSVMKAINTAIESGVSKKRAINIAVNSKTAEQALRRLDQATIDKKELRIITQGGPKALNELEKIVGVKLAPKVLKILGKNTDAKSKIQAMIDLGIPKKIARILGNNTDAKRKAAEVNATKLKTLMQTLTRWLSNPGFTGPSPPSVIQPVFRRLMNSIPSPLATGGYTQAAAGVPSPTVARRQTALAERASALPTIGAGTTARGAKVRRPTLMVGEENRGEYVIATNPAYRKSNIEYLRMAAQELGVEMAAGGKRPRKKVVPKNMGKALDVEKLGAVKKYRALVKEEEYANREISIAERRVQEPDSFVREAGKNEWGEMTYEIDQGVVNTYTKQLKEVQKEWNDLLDPKNGIVVQLRRAARVAFSAIENYKQRRRQSAAFWDAEAKKQDDIVKRPLPDAGENDASRERRKKAEEARAKAKTRREKAKGKAKDERAKIGEAETTRGDIAEDQKDLDYRKQEYKISDRDLKLQMADVAARATDEMSSSNPTAPEMGTASEQKIGSLEASRALAQAGLGGDEGGIIDSLIGAWTGRLGEAEAMLKDSNPYNDQDAYSIMAQAGSAIAGLKSDLEALKNPTTTDGGTGGGGSGGDGSSGPSLPQQLFTHSSARGDLFRQFGSNFSLAGIFGRINPGSWAYGRAAYPNSRPSGQGAGSVINVTNHFPTPPADPHTWSRGIAYELQAAL